MVSPCLGSMSIAQLLEDEGRQGSTVIPLLAVQLFDVALSLIGRVAAAAEAEGEIAAGAAAGIALPVAEVVNFRKVWGYPLPDITALELLVADQGWAFVETAVVVDD